MQRLSSTTHVTVHTFFKAKEVWKHSVYGNIEKLPSPLKRIVIDDDFLAENCGTVVMDWSVMPVKRCIECHPLFKE